MAIKKSGLGRSLSALLGPVAALQEVAVAVASPAALSKTETHHNQALRRLPLDIIERSPYQPRQDFSAEALNELAESIRHQGVIQPIVVRSLPQHPGRYELIAGERRWRAAQLAELTDIPAVIHEASDEVALALALIENIQRENLNAIEEAIALQRLHQEFSLTHQQIAEAVGKSRTAVTNLLRLLNLEDEVKQLLAQRKLEMGHARALLTLPLTIQRQLALQVVRQQLSVRETERLAAKAGQPTKRAANESVKRHGDVNIKKLQEMISEKLCARVVIQHTHSGKGKFTVHYNSVDELEGVLSNFVDVSALSDRES